LKIQKVRARRLVVAFTKSGERWSAGREASGGDESAEHGFLNQTVHGPSSMRCTRRASRALQDCEGGDGDAHVQVEVAGERKTFSPPEISAMILSK